MVGHRFRLAPRDEPSTRSGRATIGEASGTINQRDVGPETTRTVGLVRAASLAGRQRMRGETLKPGPGAMEREILEKAAVFRIALRVGRLQSPRAPLSRLSDLPPPRSARPAARARSRRKRPRLAYCGCCASPASRPSLLPPVLPMPGARVLLGRAAPTSGAWITDPSRCRGSSRPLVLFSARPARHRHPLSPPRGDGRRGRPPLGALARQRRRV